MNKRDMQQKTYVGEGVRFERIRRITGYLVGTLDRWNDAKRAEERDRVKHGLNQNQEKKSICDDAGNFSS